MMPNHGGDPRGPSWDQWGPIGAKKWVKTVKNYHASNSNLWLLRGHRFRQKIELTVKAPNHGGEPLGSILGPMGCHWDKKMGQNRKKLPCPKIRIFDYYARGHRFGQKKNYVYGTKSRWGPPRVHLGVNGDQLGPKNQKMGENRKKLPFPKFEFLTTPRSSIWAKNRIYGYDAKSRWGTPEVHPKVNGVPLGPKNGSKP